MYHAVGGPTRTRGFRHFAISRGEFAEQLDALEANGFTAITAEQLAQAAMGIDPLPERPVVLTFDDAYTDFLESALPELTSRSMVGTVFVPTAYVGRPASWLLRIGEGWRKVLGPAAIREIRARGIECGAHSHSHRQLDRGISEAGLREEVYRPRAELEELLGARVATFAYPFGYHSRRVRRLVEEAGYVGGFAVSERPALISQDDRLALPRLRVSPGLGAEAFMRLLNTRRTPFSNVYAETTRWASRSLRRLYTPDFLKLAQES